MHFTPPSCVKPADSGMRACSTCRSLCSRHAHYASSLGKEVFAESETFSLGAMYQDTGKRPTLAALAKEVCA